MIIQSTESADMVAQFEAAGAIRHLLETGCPVPFSWQITDGNGRCMVRAFLGADTPDQTRIQLQQWAAHLRAPIVPTHRPDGRIHMAIRAEHWGVPVEVWDIIPPEATR